MRAQKKKWKYDKSLKIVYKASWPETAEKWIHSWLTRQSGSSAVCFMEIYGECHKSYCTHMCYNNIMKNSLSKALKYIKAQVPSLHHLLPLPTVTTPHMSVQCKKKELTHAWFGGGAWHRFIKPPTICSIWHDCLTRDLYWTRGLPEHKEKQGERYRWKLWPSGSTLDWFAKPSKVFRFILNAFTLDKVWHGICMWNS